MKKLIVILVMFLLSLISGAEALDTLSTEYMPMHVGDFWVYDVAQHQVPGGTFRWNEKLSVVCLRTVNNHVYYYLKTIAQNHSPTVYFNGYYRVDSLTGSLMKYDSIGWCSNYHFESLSDSLAAVIGDSVMNCNSGGYKCNGINRYFIFGDSTTGKLFKNTITIGSFSTVYNKSFYFNCGLYSYSGEAGGYGNSGIVSVLKGCRINGIVYGDTIQTGIFQINTEIPAKYSLGQNYPNPFNPTTKIRFSIVNGFPIGAFGNDKVVLKVYDVMGREVQTLVNERLQPGTYEAAFDGSSLNSGVYFYKISAGDYSETKKMLLIK
ncbi:MAG: T9SS type A sorting domain-containing protein [Ignavibacteriae bacterium]|nr:T9SS type A sorting domain-containing protein [Ignavibacteriota bacterium]